MLKHIRRKDDIVGPFDLRKVANVDLIRLPQGRGVRSYVRDVEDAYLVLEGVVTVGWEEDGRTVEQRLGPKDVMLNPAGRRHWFRNDGFADAEFMMVVGTPKPEDVRFVGTVPA